jgi:hypothetical protein
MLRIGKVMETRRAFIAFLRLGFVKDVAPMIKPRSFKPRRGVSNTH